MSKSLIIAEKPSVATFFEFAQLLGKHALQIRGNTGFLGNDQGFRHKTNCCTGYWFKTTRLLGFLIKMTLGAPRCNSKYPLYIPQSPDQSLTRLFAALLMTLRRPYSSRQAGPPLTAERNYYYQSLRAEFTQMLRFWASSLPSIFVRTYRVWARSKPA